MAQKRLIVESEVHALARGSELVISKDVIITPAALDAAFARQIRVVRIDKSPDSAPSVVAAPTNLWQRMHQGEGTYVVQVKNGRATVSRLTDQGPIHFGSE
ncbi:MAG: hypothetical protein HZA52_01845 [Planctomycetes bacterium]|nr:hypothetical protein [Planctomycetota bacterium]